MFSRLDTIPACDRQTDRRTDTARRQRPRYAQRRADKNSEFITKTLVCLE